MVSLVARQATARWHAFFPWLDRALSLERGRLAPWLAVAMAGGIVAYFSLREEPPAWAAAPGPALLLAALLVARRAPHTAWGVGLFAAAALGFAAVLLHARAAPPPMAPPMRAIVLSGFVQDVDLLPEGRRVTLGQVRFGQDDPPQPRTLRVRLRADDPARPAPGDLLTVRALVRAPSTPAFPGAWDFQRAAFFSGQGGSGFALGPAGIEAGTGKGPPLSGLRATIEAHVAQALPGGGGAVAAALLTGGQSAIPREDLAAMRDSGLAHLLSVSGLHIAIVMGVTFWVLRLLLACIRPLALRVDGKVVAGVGALAAGGFYMLLTGAQVPMQRSFAMAALVTLALLAGRNAISMRGLALAATVVMLLDPSALLGPSFQMSFAAVMALIAGWEALRGLTQRIAGDRTWWRRLLVFAAGLICTSVLAGAATGPVGLAHFGRLQWYGVAANAIAVPLTSVLVMPAGMAALLLMPFGLEGPALAAMGWGVEGVLATARMVAAWPGAASGSRPLPGWGLLLFLLGLCWLCLWGRRWRLLGLPIIALGISSAALHRPPDLLVSADARLIGVAAEGGLWLQRLPGASAFVRDQWLRAHGLAQADALPVAGEVAGGAVRCDAAECLIRARPDGTAALLLRQLPAERSCGRALLLVSAEPIRFRCGDSTVIDRFSVWRDGPHAAWFGASGPRIVSDRAWRGARPWVPPPPRPRWREDAPPAPAD